jgi:acetolactate synthase-1/2/3 large subunit
LETTGAEAVVEVFVREGVECVFSLPGTTILDIYDAMAESSGIRHIVTRHEQGAAHMADGYARASGKVGVCMASRGPGAANMASAILEAYAESVPLVAIIGSVADSIAYRDAFEEMDLVSSFRPITKACFEVHRTERIPEILHRAFREARSGRPRPVLVSLPHDVQKATADFTYHPQWDPSASGPSKVSIKDAVDILISAQQPGVYAGGGVIRSGATKELVRLAERLKMPVVTSWGRKDAYPETNDFCVGMMGNHATAPTRAVLGESDVILAIGTRFSEFSTSRWRAINPSSQLIHIDIDPNELGKIFLPAVGIAADAGEALKAMLEELDGIGKLEQDFQSRQQRCEGLRKSFLKEAELPDMPAQDTHVSSPAVIRALGNIISPDDILLFHSVTFEKWFLTYYNQTVNPGSFYLGTGGTLGWGLPAAMGIQIACPQRKVVAVIGDGGFLMNIQELETAAREKIPVKVLVMNNFCYGNVRSRQVAEFGGRLIGCLYGNPDFSQLAALFGVDGHRMERDEDVLPVLSRAMAHDGPSVVDVIQSPDEGLPEGTKPQVAR